MATEDIRIEGGRLTVERPVAHKANIDIDLSEVESVYFERSLDPTADAALVLTTRDSAAHLVRVSNEDADTVLGPIYDAWRGARRDAVKDAPDLLTELEQDKGVGESQEANK